jgi:hypothetical protein
MELGIILGAPSTTIDLPLRSATAPGIMNEVFNDNDYDALVLDDDIRAPRSWLPAFRHLRLPAPRPVPACLQLLAVAICAAAAASNWRPDVSRLRIRM